MLRLRYALLLEEELNNREVELNDLLQFKKEMKVKCYVMGHACTCPILFVFLEKSFTN